MHPARPAERRAAHVKPWEVYSVIVATVVGLLSLAVSAYTAYMLHVQTRAQVFPYLQVVTIGEQARVAIHNKGVGPAFLKERADRGRRLAGDDLEAILRGHQQSS